MIFFYLLAASTQAPAAQVERLDENSFLMSLVADPALSTAQAQTRLAPAAGLACQARRPVLGRFRFVTAEAKTAFEQELLCVEPGHKLSLLARTEGPIEPSRADQQAVLAASYRYFAAKDSGAYAGAHQLLSDGLKGRFPLDPWSASARAFNGGAGAVRARRIVEITWYRDPEDAPEPGLYVAADFSAEFEQLEFVCGYLMWQVRPDGSFRLTREEQNAAPKRPGGRPIASIDRDPLRARMGCKD
jgi:hypothetical protein